jgi:hypothetical protein
MSVEPTVVFNMDLANGKTSARFCYEAAQVLGLEITGDDPQMVEDDPEDWSDLLSSIVDEWTEALNEAGYYVWWNAGDVVVYDLRPLTDEEREAFNEEMENA